MARREDVALLEWNYRLCWSKMGPDQEWLCFSFSSWLSGMPEGCLLGEDSLGRGTYIKWHKEAFRRRCYKGNWWSCWQDGQRPGNLVFWYGCQESGLFMTIQRILETKKESSSFTFPFFPPQKTTLAEVCLTSCQTQQDWGDDNSPGEESEDQEPILS